MFDSFFDEAMHAVSLDEFDEKPVGVREFVESENFLSGGKRRYKLSEYQYEIVENMTQIYYEHTLIELYGEVEGRRKWLDTKREIYLQLGKASGKDFTSTIAVAYIVYLCLCLKDPQGYFKTDSIDIINVAINADQANRVFFKNLLERIKECPWFNGKFDPKRDSIEFGKGVFVYSGHSEREGFEGYNTLVIILDEISGFALESTSGNARAKTAGEVYDWARGSVSSRFSETGKVALLSFPRFKDDFIQQMYNEVVVDKTVIPRSAHLKIDPNLPDGYDGNEFDVHWDEDHIHSYKFPGVWALRRPTWEVNPNKDLQKDLALDFFRNPGDALGRFACMPSNLEDGFFKNAEAVQNSFVTSNGIDDYGTFLDSFVPKKDTKYFIHVDLAQVHDRCAIAMSHVSDWKNINIGSGQPLLHPVVTIDLIKFWKPTKDKSVDFDEVRNFIISLRDRGFKIKLCTFDRWNSFDSRNILEREHDIKTDTLSVAVKHYDDFLSVMYGGRLIGPHVEELIEELGQLRLIKNKVDHPRAGYKDLSDAVCGAIHNAVEHTPKPQNMVIEPITYADLVVQNRKKIQEESNKLTGPITAPKRRITEETNPEVVQFLAGLRTV